MKKTKEDCSFKNEDGTPKNGKYVSENGNCRWYKEGEYHRLDGPALEYSNGDKYWFVEGELHRENGPAVEEDDLPKGYYLYGVQYTKEEYEQYLSKGLLRNDLLNDLKEKKSQMKIKL